MSTEEKLHVIDALNEALNARDMDRFAALFTESVIFSHPAFPEPQKGVAIVRQFFENMVSALDFNIEKRHAFSDGDRICVEWTSSGTHKAPLQLPNGQAIPATNKSFRVQSCGVYTIKNGKISEWHVYADRLAIFGQLGIKPS
ncbi:MAG: ester cyclase [Candidatus Heimdallarchaeota archaeon]